MWIRLLLMAVPAVLLLAATAPALEPPTFSNEVVRILQVRCLTCHSPGEHAPFSLLTYRDAFSRKDDIRTLDGSRRGRPRAIARGFRRRACSPKAGDSDHPIRSSRCRRATQSRPAPATSIDAS